MDKQSMASHSNSTLGLLSERSLAKIKVAKMEAVAELLTGLTQLSRHWDSVAVVSMAALEQHDSAELIPLFERYAERQFDSYAEELLPHLTGQPRSACPEHTDVELYARQLTDVIDLILAETAPPQTFLSTSGFSGDWADLVGLLKDSESDHQSQILLSSKPSGAWEIYVGRCFQRHMLKSATRLKMDDDANEEFVFLCLLFDMKYRFRLRLHAYWLDFEQRLRALLWVRFAHWEARAYGRLPVQLAIQHVLSNCA